MGSAYVFSLTPTFTQGLIIGQLSILCLLVVVLKYLFLDPVTVQPYKATSYQPRIVREDEDVDNESEAGVKLETDAAQGEGMESAGWLNILLHHVRNVAPSCYTSFTRRFWTQVVNSYRSKLRDDIQGAEGDEIVRKRVEEFANKIRPPGFLVRPSPTLRELS